jgi:hypothetical protein
VLGPVGVDEAACRAVAKSLREVEGEENQSDHRSSSSQSSDTESGDSLRWSKEVGLTAFLLKFGEGMGA